MLESRGALSQARRLEDEICLTVACSPVEAEDRQRPGCTPSKGNLATQSSYRSQGHELQGKYITLLDCKSGCQGWPTPQRTPLCFGSPSWLSYRVWDVYVSSSFSGFNITLRTYSVIQEEPAVFLLAENADICDLQVLFAQSLASPFDRSPKGHSLLHVCTSHETTL